MTDFAWAIVGPGRIAHRFADAVHRLPATNVRSVLGRDAGRVASFVAEWSRPGKPTPQMALDLDALLRDPGVDAVYIATPHSAHAAFIRACLQAGKPVLCEKPLVPSLAVARELVTLARERRVFLMEALWSRFLPVFAQVHDWLGGGAIGRVQAIQSSFVRFCGHLEGRAEALLQVLTAIEPAGDDWPGGFMPASDNKARQHAGERNQGCDGYRPERHGSKMVDRSNQERH